MARKAVIALAHCHRTADYEESLRRAGAEIRLLTSTPVGADAASALEGVDGLVLPGGSDVHPARYGEPAHPSVSLAGDERDAFEIALATHAVEHDVPLLAICRGMQVLNVAAGGSLIQDVPSDVPHACHHDVPDPRDAVAHPVTVAPDSRLAAILGTAGDVPVNSRHHQAVKRIAPGFRISAQAPDGVVEAVERDDRRFCIGVQWHPENFWSSGRFAELFRALVSVASRGR
jgi:putative glutamine amidotransferase